MVDGGKKYQKFKKLPGLHHAGFFDSFTVFCVLTLYTVNFFDHVFGYNKREVALFCLYMFV